jgi:phosphomannomutase
MIRQKLSDNTVKELRAQVSNDDTECAHGNADSILCDLLEKLGYTEVVAEYNKVDKWYA